MKQLTNAQIKEIFLANGFKEKDQGNGVVDLNPYVYTAARALLAAADDTSTRPTTIGTSEEEL